MGLHGDIGGGRAVYYNSYSSSSSWSEPSYSGLNRYPDHGINADYNRGGGGWSEPIYGWNNGYPDHYADDQTQDHYGYYGGRNNASRYRPHGQEVYEVVHDGAGGWGHDYSPPNPNWDNQHPLIAPWHASATELHDAGHDQYSSPWPGPVKVHTGSNHNKPRISHNGGGYKHNIPANGHGGKHDNESSVVSHHSRKHGSKASNHSKAHERQRPNNGPNHVTQAVKPSNVPINNAHGSKHGNPSNNDDDGFDTDSDDESVFTPRSRKPAVGQKVNEKPNGPNHAQVKPSHVPITTTHNGKKRNPNNNKDDDEFNSSSGEESDDE